jgi:O-antigen/teichoic acid export membrane protein
VLIEQIRAHIRVPLFGNAYALIANTGITAILGFAYWVMAARLFDATDVGLAAAAISAMSLLAMLSQFNLEAAMVRFVPTAGADTRRLVGTVYVVCIAAAAIAGVLFLLLLDRLAPTLAFLHTHGWDALFVIATVAWSIFILHDGILVGLGRAIWVPVENATFGILKLAFLFAFIGAGPLGLFASWALPGIMVVIPFTALIFWRLIPRHAREHQYREEPISAHAVRSFAAGNYLGSIFEQGTVLVLPLLVTYVAGPAENAFFYQSWIIAYTLILVAENTSRSLTVEAAKNEYQLRAYSRIVVGHTLRILVPAVVGLILLAPLLLGIFGSDYVVGGTQILRLLTLAAIPYTVVALALVVARIQYRLREVVAIQAAVALLALGSSAVLVQRYGGTGVAAAWLGTQTLMAAVLLATRLRWLYRPGVDTSTGLV